MNKVLMMNMCMIVDEENHNILVQDKVSTDWSGITFPGGKVENGESFIESTIREVYEETGLNISNLVPCGIINWFNTSTNERWLVFLYKTNTFSGNMISETEEGKVLWIPLESIYESKLAPNMEQYLELFFNDHLNEAYATWSDDHISDFYIH